MSNPNPPAHILLPVHPIATAPLDAMADALRAAGYVVNAPLKSGQLWLSLHPDKGRKITNVEAAPFGPPVSSLVRFIEWSDTDPHVKQSHGYAPEFYDWVRDNDAVVQS